MGQRRRGRAAALQMLYQRDSVGSSATETKRLFWGQFGEDAEANDAERDFADALVTGVADRAEEIDETIRAVSHHWRLERMTRVDRNILRLATCELLTMQDIPRSVTLNEAVELAKRFGSEGSASFVNGVLHRIATDLGKQ